MTEEEIQPFPAPPESLPPATQCKSTLVVTSLRALNESGLFEQYEALLDRRHRDAVLTSIAGVWLPIESALAHYDACDALRLSPMEQRKMGAAVARRLHQSMLSTIVRVAAQTGITPRAGLPHFHRFYHRTFDGGGTRVVLTAPKDARIEIVGLPLARIPYFVNAFRGLIQEGATLFSDKVSVLVLPQLTSATTIGYRIAWA